MSAQNTMFLTIHVYYWCLQWYKSESYMYMQHYCIPLCLYWFPCQLCFV